MVEKLDADTYITSLTGLKYKLAHKRAGNEKWSALPPTQRKHLVRFLRTGDAPGTGPESFEKETHTDTEIPSKRGKLKTTQATKEAATRPRKKAGTTQPKKTACPTRLSLAKVRLPVYWENPSNGETSYLQRTQNQRCV